MSDDDRDRELRESFARLRDQERAAAPAFAAVRARTPRHRAARSSARPVALALAAAAAVVVVAWATLGRDGPGAGGPPTSAPSIGPSLMSDVRWVAPTDFLLRTPGRELMRTVPSIGGADGWDLLRTETRPGRRPTPDTIRDQGRTS